MKNRFLYSLFVLYSKIINILRPIFTRCVYVILTRYSFVSDVFIVYIYCKLINRGNYVQVNVLRNLNLHIFVTLNQFCPFSEIIASLKNHIL